MQSREGKCTAILDFGFWILDFTLGKGQGVIEKE
jgi:hypothetical protein